MANTPNPIASTTPVDGRPGMVQDWDKDGNPYGQPHSKPNSNLDSAYGVTVPNPIKTHAPSGVLGGAHMGGHSDVAAKPAAKPVVKAAPAPKAPVKKTK